jgi:hypothetical protein
VPVAPQARLPVLVAVLMAQVPRAAVPEDLRLQCRLPVSVPVSPLALPPAARDRRPETSNT